MKLCNFFRSGTSHRLRIALNLKGLNPEYVAVDLRKEQHLRDEFRLINPQQLVPALELDDGEIPIQSPAIIEWLEEKYPAPRYCRLAHMREPACAHSQPSWVATPSDQQPAPPRASAA